MIDLKQVYRKSNIRYACRFVALSCAIYAVSLIGSLFESEPSFYGLSVWWLLLGWGAGAVVSFVGLHSLSDAQYGEFATQKIPIRAAYTITFLALGSVMLLFKASHGDGWFQVDARSLRWGMIGSPLIVLTSALLPAALGLHFKAVKRDTVKNKLYLTAVFLMACAVGIVGVYFLVWLDWTVGIDLYLSQPFGYANIIYFALKAIAVIGACGSLYGIYAGFTALKSTD